MGGSRNRARAVVKIVLAPHLVGKPCPGGKSDDLHILFSAYTPKALHLTRCAAALHIRKNLLQSYEIILIYANIYALFLKFFFNIFRAPFSTLWSTSPDQREHVSEPYGALLPTIRSNALYPTEHASVCRRVCQNEVMDEKTLPVVPSSWEEGLGVVE